MLVKVTATIETIVQIKEFNTEAEACEKAKKIIRDDQFGCLEADLQVCEPRDVELKAIPIIDKEQLSLRAKDWFAWNEDGGTTDKTCEEILGK